MNNTATAGTHVQVSKMNPRQKAELIHQLADSLHDISFVKLHLQEGLVNRLLKILTDYDGSDFEDLREELIEHEEQVEELEEEVTDLRLGLEVAKTCGLEVKRFLVDPDNEDIEVERFYITRHYRDEEGNMRIVCGYEPCGEDIDVLPGEVSLA